MSSTAGRATVALLSWVVGAAISVGIGLLAQSLITNRLHAGPTYPQLPRQATASGAGAVNTAPSASAGPKPARPAPVSSPRESNPTGNADQVVPSSGGTAIVRCGSDGAYLVSWSPKPGYWIKAVSRGPGSVTQVTFASDAGTVRLTVNCVGGIPQQVRLSDQEPGLPTPSRQFPTPGRQG